mmetsp:Transcript_32922/g.72724  ORF Transcript_32922/g.72724 Transcript_32922/m.72724 type:complete len:81 (-) Transcript_32922:473-715(-)|eukprot:CAMPEP_0202900978 /NCGR_PEP_ID=MMETSP1392-20130828/12572_1 /ASSEMBLY_ACC=CAM_ASM_000868 /TAXON_ID=225041 /ORGANISM="Chlamydomonas chlamydogama, Strain SAG 11-48b" /LENGTH=80 /DNA_ID=CAMNT_0049587457 /DNA_START=173 /DNA_END=418 /DNA_ORIENTATION=-
MGGGNGQKSAMKRAKNQEKLAKLAGGGGSQLKVNAQAQTIKCHVCLSTFVCTSSEAKLKEHSDNKHPTKDFYECFPHMKK